VSDYRIGDDCVWPHCSDIAKCPACEKDERIEELQARVEELVRLNTDETIRASRAEARVKKLEDEAWARVMARKEDNND